MFIYLPDALYLRNIVVIAVSFCIGMSFTGVWPLLPDSFADRNGLAVYSFDMTERYN